LPSLLLGARLNRPHVQSARSCEITSATGALPRRPHGSAYIRSRADGLPEPAHCARIVGLWVFHGKDAYTRRLHAIESAMQMDASAYRCAGRPLGGPSVIDIPVYYAPAAGMEGRRRRADAPAIRAALSRLRIALPMSEVGA
jgi:hypothetical protein